MPEETSSYEQESTEYMEYSEIIHDSEENESIVDIYCVHSKDQNGTFFFLVDQTDCYFIWDALIWWSSSFIYQNILFSYKYTYSELDNF